ncbi:hypothetical protein [Pengzhenrongella sicca]|uniref:Immunity repressor n=1 Tax=Pengzhenrongella sicca TaxID=2819238 RepID=A0A8A4ZAK6_9MICO|nr:hypothetical protein [Pengzhenrongella sicca]QTE28059.1 hypothetical protein J4E96_11700 [Pengzhenrongella sicca]
MPATKIQDESEVVRWFNEGRTYAWMTEEYERKYNIQTVPSLWGNFRRRRGLTRRIVRDDDLIPWAVNEAHRWAYPLALLRMEARARAGYQLTATDRSRLRSWNEKLVSQDLVVHYDDDTDEGFFYVPRRPGVDLDLIRQPERKTTTRPAAD